MVRSTRGENGIDIREIDNIEWREIHADTQRHTAARIMLDAGVLDQHEPDNGDCFAVGLCTCANDFSIVYLFILLYTSLSHRLFIIISLADRNNGTERNGGVSRLVRNDSRSWPTRRLVGGNFASVAYKRGTRNLIESVSQVDRVRFAFT